MATKPLPSGEDAVLLRELCHRAGNDCAVALAALRLAGGGRVAEAGERSRLLGPVIARLEASAELHRLLARPVPARVEARGWLVAVCMAAGAAAARSGSGEVVDVDVPELWLHGAVARRLAMVAAELVANAAKYATGGIVVSGRMAGGRVLLRVSDRGSGIARDAPAKGGGLGAGIVADLVALGGGRLAIDTGRLGTAVLVEMPAGAVSAPDRHDG